MTSDVFTWATGAVLLMTAAVVVRIIQAMLTDRAIARRLDKVIELLERLQNESRSTRSNGPS